MASIESVVHQVRLLISDVGGNSGTDFIFKDGEIETFLELRGNSVFNAAATALRTLAANEALVMKHITFLEMKTDASVVVKELRSLAESYEKASDDDGDVTVIEMITEPFGDRAARLRELGY